MKFEKIDKKSVKILMDIFYEKIRRDENLGKIFNNAIGNDDISWEKHKEKIGNFWLGITINEGDYVGQPLKKHLELPPFPQEFFNIWLKLFEESLNNVYNKENQDIFLQRAKMIANHFQNILYRFQKS